VALLRHQDNYIMEKRMSTLLGCHVRYNNYIVMTYQKKYNSMIYITTGVLSGKQSVCGKYADGNFTIFLTYIQLVPTAVQKAIITIKHAVNWVTLLAPLSGTNTELPFLLNEPSVTWCSSAPTLTDMCVTCGVDARPWQLAYVSSPFGLCGLHCDVLDTSLQTERQYVLNKI
jgi:hypothetical protein